LLGISGPMLTECNPKSGTAITVGHGTRQVPVAVGYGSRQVPVTGLRTLFRTSRVAEDRRWRKPGFWSYAKILRRSPIITGQTHSSCPDDMHGVIGRPARNVLTQLLQLLLLQVLSVAQNDSSMGLHPHPAHALADVLAVEPEDTTPAFDHPRRPDSFGLCDDLPCNDEWTIRRCASTCRKSLGATDPRSAAFGSGAGSGEAWLTFTVAAENITCAVADSAFGTLVSTLRACCVAHDFDDVTACITFMVHSLAPRYKWGSELVNLHDHHEHSLLTRDKDIRSLLSSFGSGCREAEDSTVCFTSQLHTADDDDDDDDDANLRVADIRVKPHFISQCCNSSSFRRQPIVTNAHAAPSFRINVTVPGPPHDSQVLSVRVYINEMSEDSDVSCESGHGHGGELECIYTLRDGDLYRSDGSFLSYASRTALSAQLKVRVNTTLRTVWHHSTHQMQPFVCSVHYEHLFLQIAPNRTLRCQNLPGGTAICEETGAPTIELSYSDAASLASNLRARYFDIVQYRLVAQNLRQPLSVEDLEWMGRGQTVMQCAAACSHTKYFVHATDADQSCLCMPANSSDPKTSLEEEGVYQYESLGSSFSAYWNWRLEGCLGRWLAPSLPQLRVRPKRKVVVFTAASDDSRAFYLPILSMLWRTRGFDVIVLLFKGPAQRNPTAGDMMLDKLQKIARVVVEEVAACSAAAVARFARIFAAYDASLDPEDYLLSANHHTLPLTLDGLSESTSFEGLNLHNSKSTSCLKNDPDAWTARSWHVGAKVRVWRAIVRSPRHLASVLLNFALALWSADAVEPYNFESSNAA
jgi:hypothetical protein